MSRKVYEGVYTFTPVNKTIQFSSDITYLRQILIIQNLTRGVMIYNFADGTIGGTFNTDTVTLVFDTSTHLSGDELLIFFEPNEADVLDSSYPSGTGTNSAVTLTNANTAYAVPAAAPTRPYLCILYNGSDTDMFFGFQNTNANGILLPAGGNASMELGAGSQVYAYCGSAGKVVTCSTKEIG